MRWLAAISLCLLACGRETTPVDPWDPSPAPAASAADPWAAPTTTTSAPASPPAAEASPLDGTWTCYQQFTIVTTSSVTVQPLTMPGIAIRHGTYTTSGNDGTVELDGSYVSFHGAGYDGWRAAMNVHQDGSPYFVFHGDNHRDAKPNDGARNGDVVCKPAV